MDRISQKPRYTASRVVFTSFIVDFTDLVVNLVAAILTGSAVIFAETLQGATNLLASLFLIIGVKASRRRKDTVHQFGYGRDLYFWTFLAALVILIATGIPSMLIGIERFINPHIVENLPLAFAVLTFAVITNSYALSISTRRLLSGSGITEIWKAFLRNPQVETKVAFLLDAMGLSAALSGIVSLAIYEIGGDIRFDGFGAAIIGFITIVLSLVLIVSLRDFIIGKSATPGDQRKIKEVLEAHKEVQKVLGLRTVYFGPGTILIDCEIYLVNTLDIKKIELLIDELEDQIKRKVPEARFIQIEVETPELVKKEHKIERPPKDY